MSPLHLPSILARGRAQRPLIGAHRGASARAPENTLAAFRAALDDGAEIVELDVHLSRDGFLPVIHDERTERTTGEPGVVGALAMADLRRRDAGAANGPQWTGQGIPELGDVFRLAGERLLVNVEVKGGRGVLPMLERRVLECGMSDRVVISSFDPDVVLAAAQLAPPVATGMLLERLGDDAVGAATALGARLLHVEHTCLTSGVVAEIHRAGLAIVAWTVNAPDEMRRLAALGVDIILSDDPALLRATVG